jgi:phosphoglucosamine mutase
MTVEGVLRLGWAAGRVLAAHGGARHGVVIGKDTRNSGYLFESALEAGLSAAGVSVFLLGPFSTPGVSFATTRLGAAAGIVISASHNPYTDNGIKFFGPDGKKLPDAVEEAIEDQLTAPFVQVPIAELGQVRRLERIREDYLDFCCASLPAGMSLQGLTLVVDCAHGATYRLAPALFERLGARVIALGVHPDGLNINAGVGSLHPEVLAETVLREGAECGIALDGDGDRVIFVDRRGAVIDGDGLLYVLALDRLEERRLAGPVVGTLMSNLGLEESLARQGIRFCRSAVGDRHVLACMEREGGVLGGESSGHLIHLDLAPAGDGLLSALQVLRAMWRQGRGLDELCRSLHRYPQKMVNVPWPRGTPVPAESILGPDFERARGFIGEPARILIRPSGTEPVVRILVEGGEGPGLESALDHLVGRLCDLRDQVS